MGEGERRAGKTRSAEPVARDDAVRPGGSKDTSLAALAAAGAVAKATGADAAEDAGDAQASIAPALAETATQERPPEPAPAVPTAVASVALPELPPVPVRVAKTGAAPLHGAAPRTGPPPSTLAAPKLPRQPPLETSAPSDRRARPRRSWFARLLRYAGYAIGGYAALCLVLILAYRFVNPPASTLMVWQRWQGDTIYQQWVPLNDISPNLIRAVIASEDAKFCQHNGVDLEEFRKAIERAKDGVPRGASTISMQVAKNLFLWSSRSYVRKAIEIPLTLVMELFWPKHRMLEIYLNIAEWGDGVYGAEAAARYHFDKAAADLSLRQAALLAVALPNPLRRDAGSPGSGTRRLARRIVARVKRGGGPAGCVLGRR